MAWAAFVGRSCGSDYDLVPPQTQHESWVKSGNVFKSTKERQHVIPENYQQWSAYEQTCYKNDITEAEINIIQIKYSTN